MNYSSGLNHMPRLADNGFFEDLENAGEELLNRTVEQGTRTAQSEIEKQAQKIFGGGTSVAPIQTTVPTSGGAAENAPPAQQASIVPERWQSTLEKNPALIGGAVGGAVGGLIGRSAKAAAIGAAIGGLGAHILKG